MKKPSWMNSFVLGSAACAIAFVAVSWLLAADGAPSTAPLESVSDYLSDAHATKQSAAEPTVTLESVRLPADLQSPSRNHGSNGSEVSSGAGGPDLVTLANEIRTKGKPPAPDRVPSTPQEREIFIAQAIDQQLASIQAQCYSTIPDTIWRKVSGDIPVDLRAMLTGAVDELADAEFSFRLELNEAIKQQVRDGAPSSQPTAEQRGAPSLRGFLKTSVEQGPGQTPIVMGVNYSLILTDHPRLAEVHRSQGAARRKVQTLLAQIPQTTTK